MPGPEIAPEHFLDPVVSGPTLAEEPLQAPVPMLERFDTIPLHERGQSPLALDPLGDSHPVHPSAGAVRANGILGG